MTKPNKHRRFKPYPKYLKDPRQINNYKHYAKTIVINKNMIMNTKHNKNERIKENN